jgi:hypothetical protein
VCEICNLKKLIQWKGWNLKWNHNSKHEVCVMTINDVPLSPLLDPLEGPSRLSCGKLGLEGCSQLPALERGRGAC